MKENNKISVEENFSFVSDEYQTLYRNSVATAFQSPTWLDVMHRSLLPAFDAKQYTIAIRGAHSGKLVAVIPLILKRYYGVMALQPADFDVCDVNTIVTSESDFERIAADQALLFELDQVLDTGDLFIFRKSPSQSLDHKRIFRRVKNSETENGELFCELDESFEDWKYKTLKKSSIKKLEQNFRNLLRDYPDARFVELTESDDISSFFESLQQLRAGIIPDDVLSKEPYLEFYQTYARRALAAGEAGAFAIVADGRVRAALFGLVSSEGFHGTLLGGDTQAFGKYSLGIQMHFLTAQYYHQRSYRKYNLGPGHLGYKSKFRPVSYPVLNMTRGNTFFGKAVDMAYHAEFPFRGNVKSLAKRFNFVSVTL